MPAREKGTGQFTKKPKLIGPKRKSKKIWPENDFQNKDQKGKHFVTFNAKKQVPAWLKKQEDPNEPLSPKNVRIKFWARNG
jgi:hypothetical protein